MSNMDSVFDNCNKQELEFDTMFDQEDSLIDTVNGVNESGEPLTGSDYPEYKDEMDPEEFGKDSAPASTDMNNAEGAKQTDLDDTSIDGSEGEKSDADKTYEDLDDQEDDSATGVKDNVEDTIDSALGEATSTDLDAEDAQDIENTIEDKETGAEPDLDYEPSDEELISIAMGSNKEE